jgi:hypothetical protein
MELAGIAALGLVSGLMIGCIGIGGVILVPALVFLDGIPIKIGIPAAMLAYVLPSLVASFVFARNKSIHWGMAASLCAGAAPTAFAGAWAVSAVNARVLEILLGLLTFLSGINALWTRHGSHETHNIATATLVGVGAGPHRVETAGTYGHRAEPGDPVAGGNCGDDWQLSLRRTGSQTCGNIGSVADRRFLVWRKTGTQPSARKAASNRVGRSGGYRALYPRKCRLENNSVKRGYGV